MHKPNDLSFDFSGTDYDAYSLYQFFTQGAIISGLRLERIHRDHSLRLLVDEDYLDRQQGAPIEVPFVIAVGYELMRELTVLSVERALEEGLDAEAATTLSLELQSLSLHTTPLHGILGEAMTQDCVLFNSQIPSSYESEIEYGELCANGQLVLSPREEQHNQALQMSVADDFYLYDAVLTLQPEVNP